jgi:hypothetical protein
MRYIIVFGPPVYISSAFGIAAERSRKQGRSRSSDKTDKYKTKTTDIWLQKLVLRYKTC